MEPYWKKEYPLTLDGEKSHLVNLFEYSSKFIVLTCTDKFSNSFSHYLKEAGGNLTKNLKISSDTTEPGWVFKSDDSVQKKLILLLKEIYVGNKIPSSPPSKDISKKQNMIYNKLVDVFDDLEEDVFEYVFVDNNEQKIIFYHNMDNSCNKEGQCILSLKNSKKSFEVFQLAK